MNDEQENIVVNLLAKMKGLGVWGAGPLEPINGPVVTAFPFKVPDNVPIAKYLAREEDFAAAVGVKSIDIRRVSGELVFFIPNKERRTVHFLECLNEYVRNFSHMSLPIMLGTDFRGSYAAFDLAEAPHILIAGSTGSGKSVFESAILSALAMKFDKEDLNMVLVDTKRLDLPMFESLPHVTTCVKKIGEWYPAVNRLMREIDRRKDLLEQNNVRNISEYKKNVGHMPYIVVMIDELADLIEHDKVQREEDDHDEPKVMDSLKRIIQICRAVGVHIIACTQRTSVDIISGTVKANFPTRISLRLPTGTDSRTILGTNGAENLLGKGDMLVKKPDEENVERFHGPFVALNDVKAVLQDRDMIRQMMGVA